MRKKTLCINLFCLVVSFFVWMAFFVLSPSGYAKSMAEFLEEGDEIYLVKGDLETINARGLERISITYPEFADIVDLQEDSVLLIAKQPGYTPIFIWDKHGKRSLVVRVFDDNLQMVKNRMEKLLNTADIEGIDFEVNQIEGKIFLTGTIASKKKDEFEKLISPFGSSIMNMVKQKGAEDLIQIDALIAEVSTDFTKSLGVTWSNIGRNFTEAVPTGPIDKMGDLFKIGEFSHSSSAGFAASIQAAISESKGKVLSRPKIVTESGKAASFMVGGEIPVLTTSSTATSVSQNVEYKSYGVSMSITPTLIDENRVDIQLSLSVTDIDTSAALSTITAGRAAFSTKSASTQLFLDNGQTVVLAGFIKHNRGETVKRVPFVSDIPVVGALFRNKDWTPNKDTELVLSLTPTIMKANNSSSAKKSEQKIVIMAPPSKESERTTLSPITVKSSSGASSSIADQAMSTSTFVPQEMVSYVRQVQGAIAENVSYPEMARQYGWEGTVKLELRIRYDGTLSALTIKESSGYDVFDQDAIETAQKLSPYSVFPPEIESEEINIAIPIVYSIKQ